KPQAHTATASAGEADVPSPPPDGPFLPSSLQKRKDHLLAEAENHAKTGRTQEALAAYEAVMRLDLHDARAYFRKGYLLNQLKRSSEALVALDEAIRLDPKQARAYLARGDALRELSRLTEALWAYDRALLLDARLVDAYTGKGTALRALQQYEQAIAAYDQ